MASILKTVDKTVSQALSDVTPGVVRGVIHLLLALYAVRFAPDLPKGIQTLFTNQYFRLFIFSLILWTAKFSPTTAIMISVAFMLSVNYATDKPLWEFLENVTDETKQVAPEVAPVAAPVAAPAETTSAVPATETAPMQAIVAVQNLAEAAATPQAAPSEAVIAEAEKAMSAIQTQNGAAAVTKLAEQAMSGEAAPSQEVIKVAQKAVLDMAPKESVATPTLAPTPEVAPAPAPPAPEAPVAPVAPVSAAPVAMEGCYPVRQYDMSKVGAFDPSEMEVSIM